MRRPLAYYKTMIKAVIFDMDGLLIDSEPLWEETYVQRLVDLGVPREEVMNPMYKGNGIRDFMKHWYLHYSWGDTPSPEELANESVEGVEKLIREKGVALPGVMQTIKTLYDAGLPLAISSSSPLHLIQATVDKLDIDQYFTFYHTGSAEDFAKPHPAVFIHTANEIGIEYAHCVVFEDSISGVIAAKAARMKCIAVPPPGRDKDPRYSIADMTLKSLEEFKLEMIESL